MGSARGGIRPPSRRHSFTTKLQLLARYLLTNAFVDQCISLFKRGYGGCVLYTGWVGGFASKCKWKLLDNFLCYSSLRVTDVVKYSDK